MDPIRIACPHCASKIIVRNPQLLGKTAPCPKCNGQVLIGSAKPKSGGANSAPASVFDELPSPPANEHILNSATITKFDDPAFNELLASENFSSIAPINGNEEPSRFRSDDKPFNDALLATANVAPVPISSIRSESTAARPVAAKAIVKQRPIVLISTIAIISSLLAIFGFWAFIQFVGSKGRPIAAERKVLPNKEDLTGQAKPGDVSIKKTDDTKTGPDSDANTISTNPVGDSNDSITDGKSSEPVSNPNDTLANETKSPTPINGSVEGQSPNIDPDKLGGLNTIASQTPRVGMESPAKSIASADEPEASDELPPIFKNFLGQFDSRTKTTVVDAGFGKGQIENELDPENAAIYNREVYHPDPKTIPDWGVRSEIEFPNLRINNQNILKGVDILGRLTGTAINVDWPSALIVNADFEKKISLQAKSKPIGALLNDLSKESGLELYVDDSGFPSLRASAADIAKRIPTDWSLAGLLPPASEQAAMEQIIRLWGAKELCYWEAGTLRWTEQATAIDQAILASFLGRLAAVSEVANDNPWRSFQDNAEFCNPDRWKGFLQNSNKRVGLDKIVTENRTVTDILLTAANETGISLLIDWPECWSHGLHPNDLALSVLRGRTLKEISSRYLEDYALDLVVLNDKTLLLTSNQVRRQLIRVVPLRLPRGLKIEDVKQSLRILAPLGDDGRSLFRVESLQGTEDILLARISLPDVSLLESADLERAFGWAE